MANYYAAARSNYVLIKDMEGLKKALKPFAISVESKGPDHPANLVCLLSDGDGGWPTDGVDDDSGEDINFDPREQVCPFMEDGQVLVTMEAGHEKLRYVNGYACAYHSDGREVAVSLDDIYVKAAVAFSVPLHTIINASY